LRLAAVTELGGIAIWPCWPTSRTSLAPLVKNSGAPHSSLAMWAVPVAQHACPRRGQGGETQRVGGGAGGHRHDVDVALEQLAQPVADAGGSVVVAARRGVPGGEDRLDDLAGSTGGVVADEAARQRQRAAGELAAGPAVAVGLAVGLVLQP
jgi:hypothetical protein